ADRVAALLVQAAERIDEHFGVGLPVVDVFGAGDDLKIVSQSTDLEDHLDFRAQCARRDRQREARGELGNEPLHSGKNDDPFGDRVAVELRLAPDELRELRIVQFASAVLEHGAEAAAVVHAHVLLQVHFLGQRKTFFGEDFAKKLEMDRFVVDEDAIEIEVDRYN